MTHITNKSKLLTNNGIKRTKKVSMEDILKSNHIVLKSGYIVTNTAIQIMSRETGSIEHKYVIRVYNGNLNKICAIRGETEEFVVYQAIEDDSTITLFRADKDGFAKKHIIVNKHSGEYVIVNKSTRFDKYDNFVIRNNIFEPFRYRRYNTNKYTKFKVGSCYVIQRENDVIVINMKNKHKRYVGKLCGCVCSVIFLDNKGILRAVNIDNERQVSAGRKGKIEKATPRNSGSMKLLVTKENGSREFYDMQLNIVS